MLMLTVQLFEMHQLVSTMFYVPLLLCPNQHLVPVLSTLPLVLTKVDGICLQDGTRCDPDSL